MIKYMLKCDAGHGFESWFQSAEAFDTLRGAGHLSCSLCGSQAVEKAVMAPRVATRETAAAAPVPAPAPPPEMAQMLEKMRRHVEQNADYVGDRFAAEARAMYLNEVPERPIYGEANGAEARALLEDGVPVAPLPFVPTRKTN